LENGHLQGGSGQQQDVLHQSRQATHASGRGDNARRELADLCDGLYRQYQRVFHNELGTTDAQICGLTAGSYTVAEQMPNGYRQIAAYLNGQQIDSTSVRVTLGSGDVIGDQTVLFVNQVRGRGN